MITLLAAYLGCIEIQDDVGEHTQALLQEWSHVAQTDDGEIELLRALVCHILLNAQMPALRLNETDRIRLCSIIQIILGLIETASLLESSPKQMDTLGEQVLRLGEQQLTRPTTYLLKRVMNRVPHTELIQQYIARYSLVTGNGGILFFCGEKCILSLSDLPSYVYQRVNDYLLAKSSFSMIHIL